MRTSIKAAAIAIAASGMALSAPASAAPASSAAPVAQSVYGGQAGQSETFQHHRRWHRGGYGNGNRRGYYDNRYRDRYQGERVYRDTRVWRGRDGRYYCRKRDGTTGLLIGGVVGALAGRELAGRGDRTLGAILGGAVGALLGRSIDRSNSYCR